MCGCNVLSVFKKKKNVRSDICFGFPRAKPHLTPYPPHNYSSFHSFGQLTPSLFFSSFSSFSFPRLAASLHSFKLSCQHLHITISTIIFPARSPENSWELINTFTSFFWGKNFSSFWWVLHSCLRFFYLSFNNDTHVIYEHWKWYLCVFMYGFSINGIIWCVGTYFVLLMTT